MLVSLMSAGCLSVKSYVDPQLPKVTYADLLQRREVRPVFLRVEFQANGKANAKASSLALARVTRVLESSKLFSSVAAAAAADLDQMNILIDNVGDRSEAAAKGVGTGLTLGLAGSMVTDGYVFTGTYQAAGKTAVTKIYKHAMHSTIGNAKGPEGLTAMTVQQAFDKIVEELVLNFLLDLQKEERLTSAPERVPNGGGSPLVKAVIVVTGRAFPASMPRLCHLLVHAPNGSVF
jgi:hypothetical protein